MSTTAQHCAISGSSLRAVDVVRLFLDTGAHHYMADAHGIRPFVVIFAPRGFSDMKAALEEIFKNNGFGFPLLTPDMKFSPVVCKPNESAPSWVSEKEEFSIDPSLLDIRSRIYTTYEICMFSFKIRPCSCSYSHDYTECPFAHPCENARRRDPQNFHSSCVPCPDFKKGTCKQGDMCEYAHRVLECCVHPAQYQTHICKDEACKNLMRLAQNMVRSFCVRFSSLCGQSWTKLSESAEEIVRITTRKLSKTGQSSGLLLYDATGFFFEWYSDKLLEDRARILSAANDIFRSSGAKISEDVAGNHLHINKEEKFQVEAPRHCIEGGPSKMNIHNMQCAHRKAGEDRDSFCIAKQ